MKNTSSSPLLCSGRLMCLMNCGLLLSVTRVSRESHDYWLRMTVNLAEGLLVQ